MMEVVAQGALETAQLVWRPGHGGFVLTVVCKATFSLRPGVSPLAATPQPVALADVYTEGGGALQVASDLVPFKKQPEVLLTGHAHAPQGKRVTSFVARLSVGEIDKAVQVVGDRAFGLDGELSAPGSFVRMPLTWDRAAGGPDTSNPAGRAAGASARPDAYGRVMAPNLLPAGQHLTSRSDVVSIVGFGPVAPLWPSRARCLHRHAAGWDPARWHERPLPADIDLAYFNAAPPDQRRAAPFGEEHLVIENLHPLFGTLSTRLAAVQPTATVERGQGREPLQLRCDTLLIDTDRGLAMLVWRGHVVIDRPDQAGRVVVAQAAARESGAPERAPGQVVFDTTQAAGLVDAAASALPFSRSVGGGGIASMAAPPSVAEAGPAPAQQALLSGETLAVDALYGSTMAFGFANAAPAVPFPMAGADSPRARDVRQSLAREASPVDPGAGLPFSAAAPARGEPPPAHLQVPLAATSGDSARAEVGVPSYLVGSEPPVGAPLVEVELPRGEEPARPALLSVPAEVAPEEPASPDATGTGSGDFPLERCAAISASIARRRADTASILEAHELDPAAWATLKRRWDEAIAEETGRGKTGLLAAFDGAYVAQLERERGPILAEEYGRLVVAAERGALPDALAALDLPRGAMMRIERVWLARVAEDPALEKASREAVRSARDG